MHMLKKAKNPLSLLILGLLTLASGISHGAIILSENFNGYTGIYNNQQYQTGLNVSHSGGISNWSSSGYGAVHAVNLDGAGNYAAMFFHDNTITLASPVAANDSGVSYTVSFYAAPAAYDTVTQATTASDGLVVNILRSGDNSVLSTYTYQPGAWAGSETLTFTSFQYTGDGSGDILLSIQTLYPTAHTFGGAIDNLTLSSIPEPSATLLVLGLAAGSAGLLRRRARASRK